MRATCPAHLILLNLICLILRDLADRNSCLSYGPDSPTTAPYTHNATPDVLDIVVVKNFVLPVWHSFGDISEYKDETGSFTVASLLPVR
jgi:hypothetical protein